MTARAAVLLVALVALVAGAVPAPASEPEPDVRLTRAMELFERYVALGQAFDPAIADLYSDDALITNRRRLPTGEVKEITLPAAKYKAIIRASMPIAKARADTSTYSEVKYSAEGLGVRITADRFSNLKKYHSPLSILVKESESGAWLIYEEVSQSQP